VGSVEALEGEAAKATGDLASAIQNANKSGRQALIVLGAGCSVAAGIPQMHHLYTDLSRRIQCLVPPAPQENNIFASLSNWLDVLSKGTGPRSLAAKTLGTLQTAHLLTDREAARALSEVWSAFSHDFVSGRITSGYTTLTGKQSGPIFLREPTDFHKCVAKLVIARQAVVVSVNFDGLTRKAIREQSRLAEVESDCVVLTSPDHLKSYYLGDSPAYAKKILAVVKVSGDVFHAVCNNPRCPEATNQVPIYSLEIGKNGVVEENEIAESLVCPECHTRRQLQLFFPGYQEKEQQTIRLMQAMWRFVAPQIGVIVVVGLSGIWDNVLLDFIAGLSRDLRDEGIPQPLFCIDPKTDAFFPTELERRGIPVRRIEATSEFVASVLSAMTTIPAWSGISYADESAPS
jgi:NAD-dependent SIR2 family protein deacetylase